MGDGAISTYSAHINIRLTPGEKRNLEAKAKAADTSLAKWGRKQLVETVGPSPSERTQLLFIAIASEINRLTIIHAADTDLATEQCRERIERQARASADAIVERWLRLAAQKQEAA